ncbi:MAG: hypothetical protein AABY27_01950 [Pseudomonadota bacterium]
MFRFFICIFIISANYTAIANPSINYKDFTKILVGKTYNEKYARYNDVIQNEIDNFHNEFILPITNFSINNLAINNNALFYPFSGPDISYPLLLFPQIQQYTLVGLEFPGYPELLEKNFQISIFEPQIEGYLKSGFFKTMNMSAQMHRDLGVIPMLIAQIGLLDGEIKNITRISAPYNGIVIDFIHNNLAKKLYYFRANLNDYNDKEEFFDFINKNHLIDNCMLKASSYKLQQVEFSGMRTFMLEKCNIIVEDDTGIALKSLLQNKFDVSLFGNYTNPYGSEFKPYYQKDLAKLYSRIDNKTQLDFCFGYGCNQVEANILVAKKDKNQTSSIHPEPQGASKS